MLDSHARASPLEVHPEVNPPLKLIEQNVNTLVGGGAATFVSRKVPERGNLERQRVPSPKTEKNDVSVRGRGVAPLHPRTKKAHANTAPLGN